MTDTRNADLTYAAGDVIAYYAPLGTSAPTGPASTDELAAPWICLGWIDTNGYIYKLDEQLKDINASGTLDPIRTLVTGAPKTIEATFLEALNPAVRALYDDVDISDLQPAGATTIATYVLPEIPTDRRYCFVFDTLDGDKETRLFAPNAKVTTRGDDQQQQSDNENLQMTISLYPATIGSDRSALQRIVNYGAADLTPFFT
jgi:hypothetical protein